MQSLLLPLHVLDGPGGSPEAFKALSVRASTCHKCPELAACRTRVVFGGGLLARPLLALVGTAPQKWEDSEGGPFVGAAGEVLADAMRAANVPLDECFFTNVIGCRTPGDRPPSQVEAANCMEFLAGQLTIVRPRVIVALGALPTLVLAGGQTSIGSWGKWRGTPLLGSVCARRGGAVELLVAHLREAGKAASELRKQEGL